jgi:copper chaperone
MKTISLQIQNVKCNGCATTITNKLSELINVSNVVIDLENGSVTFDYTDELALFSAKETLKINGYPQVGEVNPFVTKAKSFVSCAIGRMS